MSAETLTPIQQRYTSALANLLPAVQEVASRVLTQPPKQRFLRGFVGVVAIVIYPLSEAPNRVVGVEVGAPKDQLAGPLGVSHAYTPLSGILGVEGDEMGRIIRLSTTARDLDEFGCPKEYVPTDEALTFKLGEFSKLDILEGAARALLVGTTE